MPTALEISKWLFGKRVGTFDRYTEHARRTIFFGRWEALHAGSKLIEPEHLALGILRDSWLTGEILKEFSADEIRKEIVAKLPADAPASNDPDIPLSPISKRVLRFAAAAADSLIDVHIGDEHLLLGLLQANSKRSMLFPNPIVAKLNQRELRARIKAIPRQTRKESGNARIARWQEVGMPDGYTTSQLLYNPAAETVVLEVKAINGDFRPKRLLIRHRQSDRYEEIASLAEDVSYESPVTCEKQPIVVFNCKKYRRQSDGKFVAADWEGIYLIDLKTKEVVPCLSKEKFRVPAPYDERGWVTEIRAISDDAAHAYVIVGLGRRTSEKEVSYDYHLASLDLKTTQLELISHLKNTFF
jgi:hypothetical protein